MPLALPGRTKDAVVVASADADWRGGVERFLRALGGDAARIAQHVALLEERAAGRRPWVDELGGRQLPNGRPMPPARAYAELLVTESALPLYDAGGFLVSLDLHNPGNEAGVVWYDPSVVEIAIVADEGAFTGTPATTGGGEDLLTSRAQRGARFGELVATLAEQVEARFAYADVGPSGPRLTSAADPGSVVHPGPTTLFTSRLDALTIDDAHLDKIDRFVRPHVRLAQRRLAYGGRMVQFRFLFGTELRGERGHLDSPLAERLGLRSTNLQYRA